MIDYRKIIKLADSNQTPLLVFFSSLFIFISFAGTRLFLSDEGVILDQFYNLINGSLAIKFAKIDTVKGVFILIGDNLYGKFSYSLLILSLPAYYVLRSIDSLYGAHLFLLQLWALCGGIIVYLIGKARNLKYAFVAGVISYFALMAANLYLFKPIDFPKWGELLSIEFTNILISSFLVLILYLLFKKMFGNKIALVASFFVMLATPIPFYAITLKHHSLAVFLTLFAIYFFYLSCESKDNKFIYLAYISAGLCIWVRILDGAVILASLLLADILVFRRGVRYFLSISKIILISLIPFFSFNYLILGNPFSVIENIPLVDVPVTLMSVKEFISLEGAPVSERQIELLNELGYTWNANIRGDWIDFLKYAMFFKLINTFGIFLVSPFSIAGLAFVIDRAKQKIKLNAMDIFFGLYTILFVILNKDHLFSIVSDTPMVLEYRYLLMVYITMLYFAFRINAIRELIENRLKTIISMSGIILLIALIYFIVDFPPPFMTIYYRAAQIISLTLIVVLSIRLLYPKLSFEVLWNRLMVFIIALAFASGSIFLLFYYWVVSMSYISPSQNYTILPILETILKWMYHIIL